MILKAALLILISTPAVAFAQEDASVPNPIVADFHYGKWTTYVTRDGASSFAVRRGQGGIYTDVSTISFKCPEGGRCRFQVSFIGETGEHLSLCEPGDVYPVLYEVEGYPVQTVEATCLMTGSDLIITDFEQMAKSFANEISVTLQFPNMDGVKPATYSLIGFTESVQRLFDESYVTNFIGTITSEQP